VDRKMDRLNNAIFPQPPGNARKKLDSERDFLRPGFGSPSHKAGSHKGDPKCL